MQDTKRHHTHTLRETVEIELQRVRTAPGQPSPSDTRPHGHVVGHGTAERAARSFAGHPHGHVVGHGPGDPTPASLDGRPHGHVVGHAIGEPARRYPVEERTGASALTPSADPVSERDADRKAA